MWVDPTSVPRIRMILLDDRRWSRDLFFGGGPVDPDHIARDPLSNRKTSTKNPPTRKRTESVSYAIGIDGSLMTGADGSGAGQPGSGKAQKVSRNLSSCKDSMKKFAND